MNVTLLIAKSCSYLLATLREEGYRITVVSLADQFQGSFNVADADEASAIVATYGNGVGVLSITCSRIAA